VDSMAYIGELDIVLKYISGKTYNIYIRGIILHTYMCKYVFAVFFYCVGNLCNDQHWDYKTRLQKLAKLLMHSLTATLLDRYM